MIRIEIEIDIPESKLKDLFKEIVILIDTREKSNGHIIDYFEKNKILYINKKLEIGDYSYMLPKNEFIDKDLFFTNHLVIERKNSLEELSGNLSADRTRFENELAYAYDKGVQLFNLIEKGDWNDIIEGNYNTDYHVNAFLSSFISFMDRYKFTPIPINKQYSGMMIYNLCKYHFRNLVK